MIRYYYRDRECEDYHHDGKVGRWRSRLLDQLVAMARGAPEQQLQLTDVALQSLEEWKELSKPETPVAEAEGYAREIRVAIEGLRDQRISMIGKPIALGERNPDDPAEIATWRLYDKAVHPIGDLSDFLVGFTREAKLELSKMVEEDIRRRQQERNEASPGIWSRLMFWRR